MRQRLAGVPGRRKAQPVNDFADFAAQQRHLARRRGQRRRSVKTKEERFGNDPAFAIKTLHGYQVAIDAAMHRNDRPGLGDKQRFGCREQCL